MPCRSAVFKEPFLKITFPGIAVHYHINSFVKLQAYGNWPLQLFFFFLLPCNDTWFHLFNPPLSPGFFFLLCWSLFTYQHRKEIRQDFTGLGSSYWLGALGWTLLLVVEFIVFVAEQAVVPDTLPDLEKALESWRNTSQPKSINKRPFSDGFHPFNNEKTQAPKRVMSASWLWFA